MGIKSGTSHELLSFLMYLYETVFSSSMKFLIKKFPITDLMSLYFLDHEEKERLSKSKNGFFAGKRDVAIAYGIKIYPQEYFSPLSIYNNDVLVSSFSEKTCLCHHFAATWKDCKNTSYCELFSDRLKNNYYVIPDNLIGIIRQRYEVPDSFRRPLWALSQKEIVLLERILNKVCPYGGLMYSILRKFRKA
jgi:hypothetical protein